MSEVSSFFRHCPSCGRRFHIKLVSKKLVDVKRETVEKTSSVMSSGTGTGMYGYSTRPVIVMEAAPVEVDIEDFHYQYKCGHCGHEWTENRVEEHRE